MSDEQNKIKHEEKVQKQRKENPSLVRSTLIKYIFITIIVIAILYFLATYVLPLLEGLGTGGNEGNGGGEGGNQGEQNDSDVEFDINMEFDNEGTRNNMDENEGNEGD